MLNRKEAPRRQENDELELMQGSLASLENSRTAKSDPDVLAACGDPRHQVQTAFALLDATELLRNGSAGRVQDWEISEP